MTRTIPRLVVSKAAALVVVMASQFGPSPSVAGFREDYTEAVARCEAAGTRQELLEAAAAFEKLSRRPDAGALLPNTFYWQGECWWSLKEFQRALGCFERSLVYPLSNKEEPARFKVALCYARLGFMEAARWEITAFLRDFPSSPLAPRLRTELIGVESSLSGK